MLFWQIFCKHPDDNRKIGQTVADRNKFLNFFGKMKQKEHPDKSNKEMPESISENKDAENVPQSETEEIPGADRPDPDAETEALQKELAELKDKYLRLSAEFDNYRKRTLREKMELIQTAAESVLKDILPVMDDFERGLDMIGKSNDTESVKTGMELIYIKLKDFLNSNGVKEIAALNEPFDPDRHEAVTNIPAPSDDMKGKIADVIMKGYVLNGKIIRYPKVVVGE